MVAQLAAIPIATAVGEFALPYLIKEAGKIGVKKFIQTYGNTAWQAIAGVTGGMITQITAPIDLQTEKILGMPVSRITGQGEVYSDIEDKEKQIPTKVTEEEPTTPTEPEPPEDPDVGADLAAEAAIHTTKKLLEDKKTKDITKQTEDLVPKDIADETEMFNIGNRITLKWTGHKGVRPDLTNTKATILKINRKRMIVKTEDNETLNILPEQTLEYFKVKNEWIKKDKELGVTKQTKDLIKKQKTKFRKHQSGQYFVDIDGKEKFEIYDNSSDTGRSAPAWQVSGQDEFGDNQGRIATIDTFNTYREAKEYVLQLIEEHTQTSNQLSEKELLFLKNLRTFALPESASDNLYQKIKKLSEGEKANLTEKETNDLASYGLTYFESQEGTDEAIFNSIDDLELLDKKLRKK